jgi:hypothetical protein
VQPDSLNPFNSYSPLALFNEVAQPGSRESDHVARTKKTPSPSVPFPVPSFPVPSDHS